MAAFTRSARPSGSVDRDWPVGSSRRRVSRLSPRTASYLRRPCRAPPARGYLGTQCASNVARIRRPARISWSSTRAPEREFQLTITLAACGLCSRLSAGVAEIAGYARKRRRVEGVPPAKWWPAGSGVPLPSGQRREDRSGQTHAQQRRAAASGEVGCRVYGCSPGCPRPRPRRFRPPNGVNVLIRLFL